MRHPKATERARREYLQAYEILSRHITNLESTLHTLRARGVQKVSLISNETTLNLDHDSSSAFGFVARIKQGIMDTIQEEIKSLQEKREQLSLEGGE